MTKIKPTLIPNRRQTSLSEPLNEFSKLLETCSLKDLPKHLNKFAAESWNRPRGDLYHWIPVLNRFDEILENAIKDDSLDAEYIKPKSIYSKKEKLIVSIIDFTTFLLDNCSNRSLYSSATHLTLLLNYNSIPVVLSSLKLCVRIGLRYAQSRAGKSAAIAIDSTRILKFVTSLPKSCLDSATGEIREISLYNLVDESFDISSDYKTLSFQYYNVKHNEDANLNVPTSKFKSKNVNVSQDEHSVEGVQTFTLSRKEVKKLSDDEIIAKVCKILPKESWTDAMNALRVTRAFGSNKMKLRHRLVEIKCLSIAFVSCVFSDNALQSRVFTLEPHLIQYLAELIHPDKTVPVSIRISALDALESIRQQRTRLPDVLAALNANVNHGTLMYILRNIIKTLENSEAIDELYADRLFSLVHMLSVSQNAGQMLVTAGIVPLLIKIMSLNSLSLRIQSMSVGLLDHLIYGIQSAFPAFNDENGLKVLIDAVERETNYNLIPENQGPIPSYCVVDFKMSYRRSQWLRTNLVDSSILLSAGKILRQPEVFGSSVVTSCLNIVYTTLNNEPTSYPIISEAGLIDSFIESLPKLLNLVSSDILTTIPLTIGAICLNSEGMKLIIKENIFEKVFSVFNSAVHSKEIASVEVGATLGTYCEELTRHYPSLSDTIMDGVIKTLDKVLIFGENDSTNGVKFFNSLEDISMTGSEVSEEELQAVSDTSLIATFIENIGNFLDGFLANKNVSTTFLKRGGMDLIVRIFMLPNLPYDFPASTGAYILNTVLRTLCETDVDAFFSAVTPRLKLALSDLNDFMCASPASNSLLDELYQSSENSTKLMKSMVVAHTFSCSISDVFFHPLSLQGKTFPILSTESHNLLKALGRLQRKCMWESVKLVNSIPQNWDNATDTSLYDEIPSPFAPFFSPSKEESKKAEESINQRDPKFRNLKAVRTLLNRIPVAITRVFLVFSKLCSGRKILDSKDRKFGIMLAEYIASVLVDNLNYIKIDEADSELERYNKVSYIYAAIFSNNQVVLDEHRGSPQIQTAVVVFLKQLGGLGNLCNILCRYSSLIHGYSPPSDVKNISQLSSKTNVIVFNVVKTILQFFLYITSSKVTVDNPQTVALSSRGSATLPGHFDPAQFMVEIRITILYHLKTFWESDDLPSISSSIVKGIIMVIAKIFTKTGEEMPQNKTSEPFTLCWEDFAPAADYKVKALVAAGASEEDAKKALTESNDAMLLAQEKLGLPSSEVLDVVLPSRKSYVIVDDKGEKLFTLAHLNKMRDCIKSSLVDQSLEILHSHRDTVFGLFDLYKSVYFPFQANAMAKTSASVIEELIDAFNTLTQAILSFDSQFEEDAATLADLLHLFGLLINETDVLQAVARDLGDSTDVFISLLTSEKANEKVWYTKCLLIVERLLSYYSVPVKEKKKYNDLFFDRHETIVPCMTADQRTQLFEAIGKPISIKDDSTAVALGRVYVLLSNEHASAVELLNRGCVLSLMECVRRYASSKSIESIRTSLLIIFRNIVETDEHVKTLMKTQIKGWYELSRSKNPSVDSLISSHKHLVARSPRLFVEVCSEILMLSPAKAMVPHSRERSILLKPEAATSKLDTDVKKLKDDTEMIDIDDNVTAIDSSSSGLKRNETNLLKPLFVKNPSGIIKLLLTELLSLKKEDIFTESDQDFEIDEETKEKKPTFKIENHTGYYYSSFILQALTELLASYFQCKLEFINFSKKNHAGSLQKPKSTALNFFFYDLLFGDNIVKIAGSKDEANDAFRMKYCISQLAITALFTLVSTPKEKYNHAPEEADSDITFVRKFTIECLAKTFQSVLTSSDPINIKYARLGAFGELVTRFLLSRSNQATGSVLSSLVTQQDSPILAKLMYEKNFAAILTSTLSELDLNFPTSRKLIKVLLKPLGKLSGLSVEKNQLADLEQANGDNEEEDDGVASDDEESDRDDTPDLFRNSTLGMYNVQEQIYNEDGDEDIEVNGDDDSDIEISSDEDEEMDYDDDEIQSDIEEEDDDITVSDNRINYDDDDVDEDSEVEIDDNDSVIELITDSDSENDEEMEDDDEGDYGEMEPYEDEDDDEWDSVDESDEEETPSNARSSQLDAQNTLRQIASVFSGGRQELDDLEAEMDSLDEVEASLNNEASDSGDDSEDIERQLGEDQSWLTHNDHDLLNGGLDTQVRRQLENDFSQVFRSPFRAIRNGGSERSSRLEAVSNPLLTQNSDSTGDARPTLIVTHPNRVSNSGTNDPAIDDLYNLLARGRGTSDTFGDVRVEVEGPGGAVNPRDLQNLMYAGSTNRGKGVREDPLSVIQKLTPVSTNGRWLEYCEMFKVFTQPPIYIRVLTAIVNELFPAALEADKLIEEKRKELETKLAEETQRREALRLKEEQENEDKRCRENEEVASSSAIQVDRSASHGDSIMSDTISDPHIGGSATEPVMLTIAGREYDVSSLGIDPSFFDALPEDMREEVFTQQIYQHVQNVREASNDGSTSVSNVIDPEFLNALPSHIREELMAEEAFEARQNVQQNGARTSAAAAVTPADIDLSFLDSLDPVLREALLRESGATNVWSATNGLDISVNDAPSDFLEIIRSNGIPFNTVREPTKSEKRKVSAFSTLHFVEKPGIASLIRLLYLPQSVFQRDTLHELLLNICRNGQSRADIANIILYILQDGCFDKAAMEKSFAHLTNRARSSTAVSCGQQAAFVKGSVDQKNNTKLINKPGNADICSEATPVLVMTQVLDALEYLVRYNNHFRYYFLREHDQQVASKVYNKSKGKGKEAEVLRETKYPINIILSLLEKQLIKSGDSTMELMATLLQEITRPLQVLNKASGDVSSVDKSSESMKPETEESTTVPASASSQEPAKELEKESGKTGKKLPKDLIPPYIPESNLRLIVNILTAKECSSRTFQQTLTAMQHFSNVPMAKDVFGSELAKQAVKLGKALIGSLKDLCDQVEKAKSADEVQGIALDDFSSASSDQAKLLRVLTAIDYLFDSWESTTTSAFTKTDTKGNKALTTLYESLTMGPLWGALSDTLKIIQDRNDLIHVATVLLPLMEALMVVCKHSRVKDTSLREAQKFEAKKYDIATEPVENLFFTFTDEHKKILNQMVRTNPKLMSGSFSILVKNSKVLDFDNKRNYFNRRMHNRADRKNSPTIQLNVRRDQVFLDSYRSLFFKKEFKEARLNIRFQGEEGVDAGGVTREWYQVLARQIFNPDYALFTPVASDQTTFHPNRISWVNPEHLSFFKFVGRIIGKAIYDGRVLDCHFSRAVYKKILGKTVSLKDMETLDLDYYKSLVWMMENDITDIITETMSIDTDDYGEQKTIDLIPNGRDIPVTEENKHEYVRLVCEYRLITSVQEQMDNLLEGFHDIIPEDIIAIFDEQELELLISGMPDIDIEDWRNNTEYRNYTVNSPQVQWFWRAVRSFDAEERAKLLQFSTGTSKVPLSGFKALEGRNGVYKFNISRDYGNKDRLPSSHTCFNQVDLPEYDTYETLRQALLLAIMEGSEGIQSTNSSDCAIKSKATGFQFCILGYNLISARSISSKSIQSRSKDKGSQGHKVEADKVKIKEILNSPENYETNSKKKDVNFKFAQNSHIKVDRVSNQQFPTSSSIQWSHLSPNLKLSFLPEILSMVSCIGDSPIDKQSYNNLINRWIVENFVIANYRAVLQLYLVNRSNGVFRLTLPEAIQSILDSYKAVGSQHYKSINIANFVREDTEHQDNKLTHFKSKIGLIECQLIYIRNLLSSAYDYNFLRGASTGFTSASQVRGSNGELTSIARAQSLYKTKCHALVSVLQDIITNINGMIVNYPNDCATVKLEALTLLHKIGVNSNHWSDLDKLDLKYFEITEHYKIWIENLIKNQGYQFAISRFKDMNGMIPEYAQFQLHLASKEFQVAQQMYRSRIKDLSSLKSSKLANYWIQALADYGYVEKAVEVLNQSLGLNSNFDKKKPGMIFLTISTMGQRITNQKNHNSGFQLESQTIDSLIQASVGTKAGRQFIERLFSLSRFIDVSAKSRSAYLAYLLKYSDDIDRRVKVFCVMQSFVNKKQSPYLPVLFETIDYLIVQGDIDTAMRFLTCCLTLDKDYGSSRFAFSHFLLSEYLSRMLNSISENNLWNESRINAVVTLFDTIYISNTSTSVFDTNSILFPSGSPAKPGMKLLQAFWKYKRLARPAKSNSDSEKPKLNSSGTVPNEDALSIKLLRLHLRAVSCHYSHISDTKPFESENENQWTNRKLLLLAKEIYDKGLTLPFSLEVWFYYYLDHYMPNNVPINKKPDIAMDKSEGSINYCGQLKKRIRKQFNAMYGVANQKDFFDDIYSHIDEWNDDPMASNIIKRNPVICNLESYADTLISNKKLTDRQVFEKISQNLLEIEDGYCPINVYRKLLARCSYLHAKDVDKHLKSQRSCEATLVLNSKDVITDILKLANRSIATMKANLNCQRYYKKLILDELICLSVDLPGICFAETMKHYDDVIGLCGLKPSTRSYLNLIHNFDLPSKYLSLNSLSGDSSRQTISNNSVTLTQLESVLSEHKNKLVLLVNEALMNEFDGRRLISASFHQTVLNKFNALGDYGCSLQYYKRIVEPRKYEINFGPAAKYINYEVAKSYCHKGDFKGLEKFLEGLVASNSRGKPDFSASILPFSYTIQYMLDSPQVSGSIMDKNYDKLLLYISDMILGKSWSHGLQVDQVFLDLFITALSRRASRIQKWASDSKFYGARLEELVEWYHKLGFNSDDTLAWHAKIVYAYSKSEDHKGLEVAYEYAYKIINTSFSSSSSLSTELLVSRDMIIFQALIQGYLEAMGKKSSISIVNVSYYKLIVRLVTQGFGSPFSLSGPLTTVPKLSDEIQGQLIRAVFLDATIHTVNSTSNIFTFNRVCDARNMGVLRAKVIFEAFEASSTVGRETLEAMVRVYLAQGDRTSAKVLISEYSFNESRNSTLSQNVISMPLVSGPVRESSWNALFIEFDKFSQAIVTTSGVNGPVIAAKNVKTQKGIFSGGENKLNNDKFTNFNLEQYRAMRNNCQFEYIKPRKYLLAQSVVRNL
ncbi:hypothetical protein NADFUDRAFT_52972 [Nadsonia fulvescens var. elongata DSM 6958]|uniref:HECT-type E3 ubiquitin transferase n=1 Tax=Nadsonia fulvescens var. elongata DSM 6958 TaxID=857566 RepID=A0A1E3PGK5_9ASCO|nr:hypothetical protein NADFUDRAFT_52972 [Nadsonia fulvescens var. elongata DSM 6958]